jgi:hypothetical protein
MKGYFGKYRGIVTKNKDPEGHRRIQVTIPQLTKQNPGTSNTTWAWPVETASLKTAVPEVGEGVWIMFEGGDPGYPIWTGTYGKVKSGKRVNVKVLPDSVSLTGLSPYFKTEKTQNGSTEIDLVATLLAMANKIKTLEADLAALHTTLGTRTGINHTHSSAG